jgi:excisionase family DNA binding protein
VEKEENPLYNLCHATLKKKYMAKENGISFTITLPEESANAFFQAFAPFVGRELAPIVRELHPAPPLLAPEEEDLITFEETMNLLHVSRPTLTKRVAEGKIASRMMGRRRYFLKSEVLASLERPLKRRA